MGLGMEASRARCALVGLSGTAAAAAVMGVLLPAASDGLAAVTEGSAAATRFADLLVWGCAAVGIGVTTWGWLVTCLLVLDASRGVTTARAGVPVSLRRVVLVLCGVAVAGGLAAPASAVGTTSVDLPQALAGLRVPERVAVAPLPSDDGAQRRVATAVRPPETVVVERGDTLWDIAATLLGERATDDDIARFWPTLHALNEDVIGSDPGQITPGQRLALPTIGHAGAGR